MTQQATLYKYADLTDGRFVSAEEAEAIPSLIVELRSEAWASPQEMQQSRPGDYPDGTIDECEDGSGKFRRVWHDQSATWYHLPSKGKRQL